MIQNTDKPQLPKHIVSSSTFEPVHCQKDYIDSTITLQYEGDFDKEKAFEYIKRSYPSFCGGTILENEPPSKYKGYKNVGTCIVA